VPAQLRRLTQAAACAAVLAATAATALPASAAPARAGHAGRATATAATATTAAAATARPAAAVARPGARAGKAGPAITLANNVTLSQGYDAATSAAGTTYIAWIGSFADNVRKIWLCVLPRGKRACAGGVKHTASLGDSSAQGLRVLLGPGAGATLVWGHETTGAETGPNGNEIATAAAGPSGSLSAATDVATAPSFGELLTADRAPDGSVWVVTEPEDGNKVEVRPGLTKPAVTMRTPYGVQDAGLAFTGSTAVLAIQKDGAITVPVSYAHESGGSWSGFRVLARTWTSDANLGLVRTRSGIRLLASVGNSDYWPVVSRWTGGSFSRPQLTGDRNNCSPGSHDPVADASGRMADVSVECSQLAVANLSDTLHAAVARFGNGGTFAGGPPQITTTPRGRAWVVWSIESSVSDRLLAAPVLLPGRLRTVTKAAAGDRVRLTGPASCLPPVTVRVGLTGSPAARWHVVSRSIHLGRTALAHTLNGGALAGGRSYTLTGRVVFGDGSARRAVTAALTFRACPNP
jgi:hypothetical protein